MLSKHFLPRDEIACSICGPWREELQWEKRHSSLHPLLNLVRQPTVFGDRHAVGTIPKTCRLRTFRTDCTVRHPDLLKTNKTDKWIDRYHYTFICTFCITAEYTSLSLRWIEHGLVTTDQLPLGPLQSPRDSLLEWFLSTPGQEVVSRLLSQICWLRIL